MTLIELGDLTSGSELSTTTGRPHEFDRQILRRIAMAVVAVCCVLTVTGSTRPEPRALRALWSVPFHSGDGYSTTERSVYVTSGQRLTAFDLARGATRWSMPMPDPKAWPLVDESAGLVLLPAAGVVGPNEQQTFRETVAIDNRTGAELWRRPGGAEALTDRGVLLVDRADDGGLTGFRLARYADGETVWARPAGGAVDLTVVAPDRSRADRVVTVGPDGTAEVIRLADGVRLAGGHTDWRVAAPQNGEYVELSADPRHLYLRIADGAGATLTAYALDTLRQQWRLTGTARVTAYACGVVVCSFDRDGFAAYDPATGATRWRAAGVQRAQPVGTDRLLIDEGSSNAFALRDAATGRTIATLGRGDPLLNTDDSTAYQLRVTRSPPYRYVISRIDLDTGAVGLRGVIDRPAEPGCAATADRLVCPTQAGRLVVWAVA